MGDVQIDVNLSVGFYYVPDCPTLFVALSVYLNHRF